MKTRRKFIESCAAASATCLLPACAGFTFVPNRLEGEQIVFEKSHLEQNVCVGLNHQRFAAPIAVCKLPDGSLSAVAAICTHKACELRFAGDHLACPCHGSEFALTGEVLSKPATRDLRRFSVRSEGDLVYVGA